MRHARDDATNPAGNAFSESETDLLSTRAAIRQPAAESARVWRVKNGGRLHPCSGRPVAYHLYPAQVCVRVFALCVCVCLLCFEVRR